MPTKTIPGFVPMREELYGNENTFLAGITTENLPDKEQMSAHLNDRGMEQARTAFQKLFLPFASGSPENNDTMYRDALLRIRIGDRVPFAASVDVNAGIAAVMNHLSVRYVESSRSGDAVSVLHENQVITFTEPEFPPVERPFWQSMLPYVRKEKEQYQTLLERNRAAESLCSDLTAQLPKQLSISQQLLEEAENYPLSIPSAYMHLSDPVSVGQSFERLKDTPLAQRLCPQLEYYEDPRLEKAVTAWESVQDGFAIEEYLEASGADPRSLTNEQLDQICVHPHITDPASAKRLLEVHQINSPKRLQMMLPKKEKEIRRESIQLHELSGKNNLPGISASRTSSKEEKQKDRPHK